MISIRNRILEGVRVVVDKWDFQLKCSEFELIQKTRFAKLLEEIREKGNFFNQTLKQNRSTVQWGTNISSQVRI